MRYLLRNTHKQSQRRAELSLVSHYVLILIALSNRCLKAVVYIWILAFQTSKKTLSTAISNFMNKPIIQGIRILAHYDCEALCRTQLLRRYVGSLRRYIGSLS
jgi:hypothetical protein